MSAAFASVRAIIKVGVPITSATNRAAMRLRIAFCVGKRTFPPKWPHFFSEASWSSKWTPDAPASIIAFINSRRLTVHQILLQHQRQSVQTNRFLRRLPNNEFGQLVVALG